MTLERQSLESPAIDRWVEKLFCLVFASTAFLVQIDAEKVRNKTEDITRGTVQKSVCVLSRLPLYGQIQVMFLPM